MPVAGVATAITLRAGTKHEAEPLIPASIRLKINNAKTTVRADVFAIAVETRTANCVHTDAVAPQTGEADDG